MSILVKYGWDREWSRGVMETAHMPGRVISHLGHRYRVITDEGEFECAVTPAFRRAAEPRGTGAFPAIGDWVLVGGLQDSTGVWIHALLGRRSRFSRKGAGLRTDEQVVAANVDTAFIVTSAAFDFNPRRLERYLVATRDSGATPVIVVGKMDLCPDPDEILRRAGAVAPGVPVVGASALEPGGTDALLEWLVPGRTGVLLGSSGVGKSTITNALLGFNRQETGNLRAGDGKGRHTTVGRDLFLLPGGGLLIDTPGMRELQFWDSGDGLDGTFNDIAVLAESCHFRDCTHDKEPRCAVKAAIGDGRLDRGRLKAYQAIRRELAFVQGKRRARERMMDKGSRATRP